MIQFQLNEWYTSDSAVVAPCVEQGALLPLEVASVEGSWHWISACLRTASP